MPTTSIAPSDHDRPGHPAGHRPGCRPGRGAFGLILILLSLLLPGPSLWAQAQTPDAAQGAPAPSGSTPAEVTDAPASAETPAVPEVITDPIHLMRRGGEACTVGAATGLVSFLITSSQIPANGLVAPSLFGLGLGAAGLGCTLGFVSVTAATGFGYLWEQGISPYLPDTTRNGP